MGNKIDKDFVRKYFFENGEYNLLTEYVRFFDKILIEKDGYKAEISYGHFKEGNKPNFFGIRNKYQLENITLFVKRKNPNVKVIDCRGVYKSGKFRLLVKIKCECGEIFETTWDNIYNGSKVLCIKCAKAKGYRNRKISYDEKYRKDIKKRGYTLINEKEILYANKPVEVVQNNTGYRGFIYPNTNSQMLIFNWYINKSNFIYNMNKYNKDNGIQSKIIGLIEDEDSEYTQHTVLVKCECGEMFKTTYRAYLTGKIYCDKCSQSKFMYERAVQDFLIEKNIKHIFQFSIEQCKDIKPLPFDFKLIDYNILIEVDDEQHESPVKFGGISYELAEKKFISCQKRDDIKNEYCKKNNIPLLRISYKDIINEKYKEIILSFIQNHHK